ncbi:MAG: hypothetical protein ABI675_12825 [Chitinophagaceae bacterium]
MTFSNSIYHFRKVFFHPRVFIFILAGTLIIFMTFFTSNNALEIAISGVASVFIGIGVNNFSSFETHLKDEQKIKSKMGHSIKLLGVIHSRIKQLNTDIAELACNKTKKELVELEQLISISIQLLNESRSLD